jgi:hypothetical protein
VGLGVETLSPGVAMSGFFIRTLDFYQRRMKGEELIGEILRPVAKALGWIIAAALLVMFIWAVVVYVVPVIRKHVHGRHVHE